MIDKIWLIGLLAFVGFIILPVSTYLCVKMGTWAMYLTRAHFLKKEKSQDVAER